MSPAGSEEGLTLLAQGREAEIFLRPDGKVVKVMRFADWGHRVEREQAALQVLHADGLAAPESFGTTIVDGRPGLVMERIEGADFLQLLGRRPYALNRVARTLATQHVAMHRCAAPAALPELRAVLRERIEVGAEGLLPEHAAFALAVLDTLPDGDRLCHGDMHPGNILGSWDAPVVIDWGESTRGNPIGDVARTHLLMRIGKPPPGSSAFINVAAPIGGRILAARYLVAYRKLRPVDDALLRRWQVVRAAARFAEGIEEEVPALRAFLARARRPVG
ncbi:MAG: aminoglycoside phosphotransferase family protein [Actinobacteria bacterium]|nr:aminoglycoside phosphotransferase family protein [Actinomycetota bacterium]